MIEEPSPTSVNLISVDAIPNANQTHDIVTASSSTTTVRCRLLQEYAGVCYILATNIISTCMMFSLKVIPANMFDIAAASFLVQSTIFYVHARFYHRYNVFQTNGQILSSILNIVMSNGTALAYVSALYFIPLSDLNTIKCSSVVWASFLSVIILKDRFKILNVITLCLTMTGLVLATKSQAIADTVIHALNRKLAISSSSLAYSSTAASIVTNTSTSNVAINASSHYYIGVGLALLCALTKAGLVVARKQLVRMKQPHSVMNFQHASTALLCLLTYCIARRLWKSEPYPWIWMGTVSVIAGCFQALSNTLLTKAIKRESVQLISILTSLDIVYAILLQYIFFHQTSSWPFFFGSSLVVFSAIILSVYNRLTIQHEKSKQINNDETDMINSNGPNNNNNNNDNNSNA